MCLPADDSEFAVHARQLLAGVVAELSAETGHEVFEQRLQDEYPGATVRLREPMAELWPPAEPVWYVTRRPFRARIAANLEIDASIERVFAVYVERVSEWQAAVRVRPVRVTPELTGSEYATSYNMFGRTMEGKLRLVAADPPNLVRFEAEGGGVRVWYATFFNSIGSRTRIDVTGDYELPGPVLPKIVDRLVVERTIQRDIDAAHARLRDLCERNGVETVRGS